MAPKTGPPWGRTWGRVLGRPQPGPRMLCRCGAPRGPAPVSTGGPGRSESLSLQTAFASALTHVQLHYTFIKSLLGHSKSLSATLSKKRIVHTQPFYPDCSLRMEHTIPLFCALAKTVADSACDGPRSAPPAVPAAGSLTERMSPFQSPLPRPRRPVRTILQDCYIFITRNRVYPLLSYKDVIL